MAAYSDFRTDALTAVGTADLKAVCWVDVMVADSANKSVAYLAGF